MREQDYLNTILAFDYGEARIGVAIKPAEQASAEPLITLKNDETLLQTIKDLLALHQPGVVVAGRPRNLEGNTTAQTASALEFASKLQQSYNGKVELQDEALTTEQAKTRIPAGIKPQSKAYRGIIDQYAAVIILEDYLKGE